MGYLISLGHSLVLMLGWGVE